jgi:hypothetical protein
MVYLKFLLYCTVYKKATELKASDLQDNEKSYLCVISPGHAGREVTFFTDRCRFLGRDAALRRYPVNSRSKLSNRNLLNFIQNNETTPLE